MTDKFNHQLGVILAETDIYFIKKRIEERANYNLRGKNLYYNGFCIGARNELPDPILIDLKECNESKLDAPTEAGA